MSNGIGDGLMREVIKRDGSHVVFDENKIYQAILKAMKFGSGVVDEELAQKIAHEINLIFDTLNTTPTIFQIETFVYLKLIENGHELTAKAYEGYRAVSYTHLDVYKRQAIALISSTSIAIGVTVTSLTTGLNADINSYM